MTSMLPVISQSTTAHGARQSEEFRGPDFFVVLGIERKPRTSWVVWQEDGKYPNVIVEILSPKTNDTDRGLKKQIYQDIFRTPDYFWFDPVSLEFKGFELVGGKYQELQPNPQGWLWSQQLEVYLGIHSSMLRLFTVEGQLVQLRRNSCSVISMVQQRWKPQNSLLETEGYKEKAMSGPPPAAIR